MGLRMNWPLASSAGSTTMLQAKAPSHSQAWHATWQTLWETLWQTLGDVWFLSVQALGSPVSVMLRFGLLVWLGGWAVGALLVESVYSVCLATVEGCRATLDRVQQHTDSLYDDWMPDGQMAELEGGRVHYVLLGRASGPLIVLIPGVPRFSRDWLAMAKHLAQQGFQVLAFDFLGTGFSEAHADVPGAPDLVCDTQFYAEQTMELIDTLGFLKPFTLCGYSTGAPIAMSVAACNPERVSRLVLFSPCGVERSPIDFHTIPSQLLYGIASRSTALRPLVVDAFSQCTVLACTYVLPFLLAKVQGKQWELFLHPRILASLENWQQALRNLQQRWNTWSFQILRTANFRAYTLSWLEHYPAYGPLEPARTWDHVYNHPKKVAIFWGRQDQTCSYRQMRTWKKRLPQATLYTIDGGDHNLLTDNTLECAQLLSSYIKMNMSTRNLALSSAEGALA